MERQDRNIVTAHYTPGGKRIPRSVIFLPLPNGMPTVDGKEYPLRVALDQSLAQKLPVVWGVMELSWDDSGRTKVFIVMPSNGDEHAVEFRGGRVVLFIVDARYLLSVYENGPETA